MNYHHYSKAPIIEAVIDFGIVPPEGLTPESLTTITSAEAGNYSDVKELQPFNVAVNIHPSTPSATPTRSKFGYIASDHTVKRTYQVRLNGFTYSKLTPYDRWETLVKEGKRLWLLYRNCAKPAAINRLAIRFINRLDLPMPVDDFKDWLRTVPEVAPEIQQSLTSMVLQFQSPQNDLLATLNFTEAIVPPPSPKICSIVLDIDLFRDKDLPQDEAEIWAFFETLRIRKNEIFEACITDKTRRLFD